ncbi:MAG: hypothetical protein PHS14_20625 [Elusimicrobia bacterium]|nr:hypothetical protein [Elusimicrobiota bacterium]
MKRPSGRADHEKAMRGAMRDVREALERRIGRERAASSPPPAVKSAFRADRLLVLEARVLALETALRALRAAAPADLDRTLNVKETAVSIGKAGSTLAHWLRDAQLFDRYQLAALVRRDVTGHWVSSPRLVARWKAVVYRGLQELAS